jgi:hypothetical protein
MEFRPNVLYFAQPRNENFGISYQKQLKLSAFRSAKFKEFTTEQLKLTVFCSAAQRSFLEFVNKNNSN